MSLQNELYIVRFNGSNDIVNELWPRTSYSNLIPLHMWSKGSGKKKIINRYNDPQHGLLPGIHWLAHQLNIFKPKRYKNKLHKSAAQQPKHKISCKDLENLQYSLTQRAWKAHFSKTLICRITLDYIFQKHLMQKQFVGTKKNVVLKRISATQSNY